MFSFYFHFLVLLPRYHFAQVAFTHSNSRGTPGWLNLSSQFNPRLEVGASKSKRLPPQIEAQRQWIIESFLRNFKGFALSSVFTFAFIPHAALPNYYVPIFCQRPIWIADNSQLDCFLPFSYSYFFLFSDCAGAKYVKFSILPYEYHADLCNCFYCNYQKNIPLNLFALSTVAWHHSASR